MRRRSLYVCALLLIAAVALYFPLVGGTAASGPASNASKKRDLSNYDALAASKRSSRPEVSAANGAVETPGLQEDARLPMEAGHVVQMEGRLGVPTFLWATDSGKAKTLSAVAATRRADASATAFEHLGKYASRYRLSGADIADLRVAAVHDTGAGAIVVKLKQTVGGIEVFRDEMNVIMNRKLQLIAISGYVTGSGTDAILVDSAAAGGFKLTPAQAVASAAADLTGNSVSPAAVRAAKNPLAQATAQGQSTSSYFTADLGGSAQMSEPARVKQVMYHTDEGFVPAYYVEEQVSVPSEDVTTISEDGTAVQTDSLYYAYVISAVDGQLLFRKNLTEKDGEFTYRVWAGTSGAFTPFDGPQGNVGPYPTTGLSGFVAPFVATNDVTLSNSPFSKNDPWLPAGATETNGNNADAYVDLGSGDGFQAATDFRSTVTAPGQFLHTFDPNALPNTTEQRQGAIQQLFFDNNFLHDWYYDSGFDEAAGNAQTDNFGRGGIAGDSIKAEGQDSSGTNNANMSTPSDGGRPRMQMYIFSGPTYNNVLSPAAAAGARSAGTWQSGPQSFDYTGNVFIPSDGGAGCTAASYTGGSGKIALVNFEPQSPAGGTNVCSLSTKRNVAIANGATGFILVYLSTAPNTGVNVTGVVAGITIPLSTMTWNGAAGIKTAIGNGDTVSLRMYRGINSDGTIDNQVIFHEWGHYLSNRLVGDAVGLGSNQSRSMGEGWGDFNAMLLTVREGDDLKPSNANFNGTYALAGYATGHDSVLESYYYGIRRAPYSTDMSKNGYTFKNIMDGVALPTTSPSTLNNGGANSEVHNSGEVWATMLWECYASLLRDTGRLTFAQAQERMKGYLVASLKMTPINPTYTEARDAVLAAAYANDPADGDLFMQAFAKRGMGVNAVAPDRFSSNHSGVVESYEVGSNLSLTSVSFNDDLVSCDSDGYLDNNEKGTLTVTLKNTGSQPLTNTVATVSSTNAGVKFPAGVVINFPAVDPLETTTGTLVIEGKGLSGIQSTDYTITFSDAGTANGQVGAAHFYAKLNVDESPASSKNEDFESKNPAWTKGFNASFGNHQPWVISNNGADYMYHAPDVGGVTDQYLISPPMTVSTGSNFIISFLHRHSFEFDAGGNYDGGRVEITTNGGANWTPIGTSPAFYNGTLLNNTGNPLQNQAAFVKQNASYPNFDTAAIDLGTTYQGQTVQIRFRAASDTALGAGGWDIASVNFTGIDNTPFTTLIADPGPCAAAVTLTMTPASLPTGTVNNAYSVVLNGAGGTGPYTYDAPTGLPNGLTSAPFGAGLKISGTPTESGSFPITVNFHDSASNNGSANYTLVVNKGAATISLSNLSQVYDGTAKEATATTTPNGLSGVTVTYSQGGNPVASPTNAGSYAVLAHLDNTDYAAPDKTGTLVISKASQTIDFAALASKVFKDPAFTISATATSGLPVTFKVISGPAFLSGAGDTVNLTGAGTVKIRASQLGNANYNAAPVVDQTFTVAKATATISVGSLSQAYTGAARKVTVVTSPAGLAGIAVTYKQGGVTVTPINVGSYDVHVTLTNANYQATPVDTTLVITKATQKITFPVIADRQYSPTPFNISATASSGLPVSFQVISGPATVSGNSVTMTGTGTVKIRATQAGNSNYIAAPYVDRTFKITP
jgi:hypothetical protein